MRHHGRWLAGPFWVLFLFAVGCSGSQGCSGSEEGPLDPASPEGRAAAFEARLPEVVSNQAQAGQWPIALGALSETLHQGQTLSDIYAAAGHKPRFARAGALTPAGAVIHETLARAGFEGLKTDRLHLSRIDAVVTKLEAQAARLAEHSGARPPLGDDEIALLTAVAEAQPAGPEAEGLMWSRLLDASKGGPLGAWITEHQALLEGVASKSLEMELLLADGALAYARDVRHFNLHEIPEDQRESMGEQIVADRQRLFAADLLEAAASEDGAEEVRLRIEGLRPSDPQYPLLVAAAERYQSIVDAGGWPTAMPRIPKPKNVKDAFKYKANYRRYPEGVVEKIKARLAAERLYEGTINNSWDKALTEAVVRYRRNNQLRDKPWIDYEMTRAMMVSAEFRLAQIKLNLQRLRASGVGSVGDYYIHVNLPEYKGQIFDAGQRVHTFKTISGSRRKQRDKSTREWVFQDATPLLSAKMDRVVINPSWTVPTRLRAEIERKAKDDPDHFSKYGYERVGVAKGSVIRQKPGPDNALGKVKFLFPNEHDIYLHDTPDRDLFWHEVRAFSHGCIRVEKPLVVAQLLLSREDASWTKHKLRRRLSNKMEAGIELKDGPEVHLEYITVRADPATGDVRFLWDIYHHDIAAIKRLTGLEMSVNLHYP